MKIQNLAIIFIVIILPILLILGYYLNLQAETLELQTEYDTKLAASVKEGIKAYEINTVNWREVQGEERRNVRASMTTFITSLANNLGVAGTAKEYMINYIPAVVMTMYDGYYIYSPAYVPQTIENEQGIQLYYDGIVVTTDVTTSGKMNDVIYEPAPSATNRKTAWYYYTDENGNEQKKTYTFVTEATQANKVYEHTLSNEIPYSATYSKGNTIEITVNYTLDNRIYVYGKDKAQNKDINEQGSLVFFDTDCKIPKITIKANANKETDIIVNENSRIDKLIYNGSNINAEILTEQIVYKENATSQENLGTYKYIYDIQGRKLYYDDIKGNFFNVTDSKIKNFISEDISIKAGDDGCYYKSVSILTSDSTYKKLYQVLNGRDKGKWFISLKEDPNRITEIGPGIEVIDTEIKEHVLEYGFSAIYMDYSAISYYVEAYAFTNWMRDRLGGTVAQTRTTFDEDTNTYKQENITLNNIFDIGYADPETGIINDLETEFSLISEHKREVMIDTINSNLNLSISNYAQNTAESYRMPVLEYKDWEQIFTNISMIAFFQGVQIGLKTYNNYAIATSSSNRDYVDPDELYFSSKSTSYHRPYCTQLTLANIEENYKGYRSVEYTLRTYSTDTGDIYYYQHTNQPTTTDNSDLGCYYCIVNKANYTKTINITSPTVEQTKISDIQAKAYKEALARERYYQDEIVEARIGVRITYNENLIRDPYIVQSVTNINPNVYEIDIGGNHTIVSLEPRTSIYSDLNWDLSFDNWNTEPDGSGQSYKAGQVIYSLTEDITLYAQYKLQLAGLIWKKDYYWTSSEGPSTLFNEAYYRPGWTGQYGDVVTNFHTYIGDGSISYIHIEGDSLGIVGNSVYAGKGACWTTFKTTARNHDTGSNAEIKVAEVTDMSFKYDLDFGDSISGAGVIFNLKGCENDSATLSGYMLSFNFITPPDSCRSRKYIL